VRRQCKGAGCGSPSRLPDILVRQLWGVRISDLYAYRTETEDEELDYDFNNDGWYD